MNISSVMFYELFVVLYSLHFHGSSLIEEEHQIWYFSQQQHFCFSNYLFDTFKSLQNFISFGVLFACIRFMRSWNNSGQNILLNTTLLITCHILIQI